MVVVVVVVVVVAVFVVYCCSSVIHATIGIKVGVVYQELPSISDAYLSMNKQKPHLHITVKKP